MKRNYLLYLEDMCQGIDKIDRFVEGNDVDSLVF